MNAAWKLVKEAAKYSHREPYWELMRKRFGIRERDIKDALRFLEAQGELRIRRSIDGRRLYVLTLRDIRKNPVRLDRWLTLKRRPER